MELQGALGISQLKKIETFNQIRQDNYKTLVSKILNHPLYRNQFDFIISGERNKIEPVWFGFPCLLKQEYASKMDLFLTYLSENGVENRPILTGNYTQQPVSKLNNQLIDPSEYPGAERVHSTGFYIGINSESINFDKLSDILVSWEIFLK